MNKKRLLSLAFAGIATIGFASNSHAYIPKSSMNLSFFPKFTQDFEFQVEGFPYGMSDTEVESIEMTCNELMGEKDNIETILHIVSGYKDTIIQISGVDLNSDGNLDLVAYYQEIYDSSGNQLSEKTFLIKKTKSNNLEFRVGDNEIVEMTSGIENSVENYFLSMEVLYSQFNKNFKDSCNTEKDIYRQLSVQSQDQIRELLYLDFFD